MNNSNMDSLINLFTQGHGKYKQFLQFEAIVLFLIILVFFSKMYDKTYAFIIILIVFGLIMSNTFIKVTDNEINDKNKITYYKLAALQDKVNDYIQSKLDLINNLDLPQKDIDLLVEKNKLNSLYIDSSMIHFLYSIISLYQYNPNEYYLLLKGTNNILKLLNEIQKFDDSNTLPPENISTLLQSAMTLRVNCLNNLQNFIYSVPKGTGMNKYIEKSIIIYDSLISVSIKKIYNYNIKYINKKGINTSTKFIRLNETRPFEDNDNYNTIPVKNSTTVNRKLIDLYV
jgi:hypothetical protein